MPRVIYTSPVFLFFCEPYISSRKDIVYPIEYAQTFVLIYFIYIIILVIFIVPYHSGLLHWYWGNCIQSANEVILQMHMDKIIQYLTTTKQQLECSG